MSKPKWKEIYRSNIVEAIKNAYTVDPKDGRKPWKRGFSQINPIRQLSITINSFEPETALVYFGVIDGYASYCGTVKIKDYVE